MFPYTAFWSFALLLGTACATCYFPDHSVATNFTTCNQAATDSHCCRPEEACLSNGYCMQQTGYANRITRGACTDQTFSSPACPQKCTDVAQSVSLSIYLAWDSDDGMFCCRTGYNLTSSQCTTSSDGSADPFTLPSGLVIINRADGTTLPTNWTSNEDSSNITVVTSTVTATPESKSITPIAAGIAVPLGVCLAAALAGCAVLWLQLRKMKRRLQAAGATAGYAGIDGGRYDEHKDGGWSHASPMGANTPGTELDYHVGLLHSKPVVEAPTANYLAEAPTEREPPMADSRSVLK